MRLRFKLTCLTVSLEDAPNPPYFDGDRVVLILKGRVLAEMSISNFRLLLSKSGY